MLKYLLAFMSLFCFSSCARTHLSVFTETVAYTNLASFIVGTPDPELDCPDHGERLVISWSVECLTEETHIEARIRFRNLQEVSVHIAVDKPKGHTTYRLVNNDYDSSGGILTYKIFLMEGEKIIEETRHALWTELILF